jgi:hypothetical protein
MQNIPFYVYLIFGATVVIAIWLFFKASHYLKPFLVMLLFWISLQSILAINGFYNDPKSMTARFPLLFLPALLFLIYRFSTKKGRAFIDSLDLPTLTLISTVRLFVEFVLFYLLTHKTIPEAMTFGGRNFDIFSGITAPLVYYFGFVKKILNYKIILAWNLVCLVLLVNVVSNAVLSLPDLYQKFGFERPNTALGFFPFNLLPAFLVPSVLFSMLASIRLLTKKE